MSDIRHFPRTTDRQTDSWRIHEYLKEKANEIGRVVVKRAEIAAELQINFADVQSLVAELRNKGYLRCVEPYTYELTKPAARTVSGADVSKAKYAANYRRHHWREPGGRIKGRQGNK